MLSNLFSICLCAHVVEVKHREDSLTAKRHRTCSELRMKMPVWFVFGVAELVQRSVVRQTNLEISSVRETDAGRFTCSADWTRHEHSLVVFSVSVSVTPSADLLLGSEATLQCDVKGVIEGCEVKWRSPNVDSPEWSPTAQLKPVTSSHNGTWQCIITCGSNQLSEHLTIKVQEPPPTTSTTTASLCSSKDSPKDHLCHCVLSFAFLLPAVINK
ncbi:T-cell surface glycoprotein CD4-like isoform X1 [Simochromis diagramma]|uniref:T-cell surface glycoprotein CD4-like isoform X1 n=1 Tax=Simochromis diagramma TaxID=43689 RepID=UPI001A7E227B|nr:T-cell surface glycoprotein CD4-like isoform X1 [Simochromis diagramma]